MIFSKLHKKLEPMGIQTLNKNDVFRLKGSRAGQMISCLDGVIWITQQGDGKDWILTAGERFHTRLPGYVSVSAFKDSRIKITPFEKVGMMEHHRLSAWEGVACTC